MQTGEQNTDGSYVTVTADFRKYGSIEDSIADHSAYLLGAMNGSKKRYEGLAGCTDYKKAVQIIKDGGYATSLDYMQNLCRVIEQWNLTQFDVAASVTPVTPAATLYRVRKNWSDTASQKGAFRDLSNAKACADKNPGYSVFDENGKAVYPTSTAFQPTRSGCLSLTCASAKAPARTMAPVVLLARVCSPLLRRQQVRVHPSGDC